LFEKAKKGDTTSMIFFLKNRDSDNWRDRHAYRYRAMYLSDREAATVNYFMTKGAYPLFLGWAIIHTKIYPQFRWVTFYNKINVIKLGVNSSIVYANNIKPIM